MLLLIAGIFFGLILIWIIECDKNNVPNKDRTLSKFFSDLIKFIKLRL